MLGDCRGLEPVNCGSDTGDMCAVERTNRSQGQADTVQADRVVGAQAIEQLWLPPSGVEVILGVDFEKRDVRPPGGKGPEVSTSQADARTYGQ
jgi:hypothetical protein